MIDTADIVILGGGVHGASLAFQLGERKAGRVVLLEKKWLASGPTSRSGALIRPLFAEAIYVKMVLLATGVFERWKDEIGGDAGFVQNGFLRIARSLSNSDLGGDLDLMRKLGVPFSILQSDEMKKIVPTAEFNGQEVGVFLPKGGFADPTLATHSLAHGAKQRGVEIREGVTVTGIETSRGSVQAVLTDSGRIATRLVVNCAGPWSPRIAAMAGINLPIEATRFPTQIFRRPESMASAGPILSDAVNHVYLRSLAGTLYRSAPFGSTRDIADPDKWDETISQAQLQIIRSAVHERFDAMRRTTSFGGFSALYDMTPDGHPIIGRLPEMNGFWCDCGWSGNGFASSPVAGRALAEMIVDGQSDIDLSIFAWPRPAGIRERADGTWNHQVVVNR